jgi:hypothetical protein
VRFIQQRRSALTIIPPLFKTALVVPRRMVTQALEIDFLKGCLQRIEEQRMLQALTGNPPSTGRSKRK